MSFFPCSFTGRFTFAISFLWFEVGKGGGFVLERDPGIYWTLFISLRGAEQFLQHQRRVFKLFLWLTKTCQIDQMWEQRPFIFAACLPDLDMKTRALEGSPLWLGPAASLPVKFPLVSLAVHQFPLPQFSLNVAKRGRNTGEITPPWLRLLMTNRNFTNISDIFNVFYSLLTFKKLLHFCLSTYLPLPLPSLSPQ